MPTHPRRRKCLICLTKIRLDICQWKSGSKYNFNSIRKNISFQFNFLQVLKLMGIQTSEEEASSLFSLVDANNDGKISVKEFAEYIGGK